MYTALKSRMAIESVTIEQVAKLLNLHRNTVRAKIEGKSKFYIDELQQIRDKFFPSVSLDELAQKRAV